MILTIGKRTRVCPREVPGYDYTTYLLINSMYVWICENSAKEIASCSSVLILPEKLDDIKIKGMGAYFSPLSYFPLPTPSLGVILRPLGAEKSTCIRFIWCKVLTRFL